MKTRKPSVDGDERERRDGDERERRDGDSGTTWWERGEDVFGTRGRASRVSCSMLQ